MLNIIWPLFIIISFIYAIFTGNVEEANNAVFESTKDAIQLTMNLLGTICLWGGLMQIAAKTSIVDKITRLLHPIIKRLFPDIKEGDETHMEVSMNIIANMMGMGNAATPSGLKAMKLLQKKNKNKNELSNTMAMFIVLNTASIQIIPTTIIALRTSLRFFKSCQNNCSCLGSDNMYRFFYSYKF